MRVFVTGASGLLGAHLAALLRERGHQVVALRRRSSQTNHLRAIGCEFAEGDVRDAPDDLAALMSGCSHVVHLAALVYAGESWPKIRVVNVEGTRHVLEAAAAAGVARAVHVSSVAVYGTREGAVDETTPLDAVLPAEDLYARSKREAETAARTVEAERGLLVTVLRPAAVYGEGDRLLAPAIARVTRRRVVPLLGKGDNTLPVVYAGNVALALLLALEAGQGGVTYDVGMDYPLTQRQLIEGMARALGRSPTFVPIPAALIRGGAGLLRRMGVSTPGARQLPIERFLRIGLGENPYRSERIRRQLGWEPTFQHAEALERTGRWLKEHL